MGRTVIPVRHEVEAQLEELRKYLICLHIEDRHAFEKLYADVKRHLSAITYANPLNPVELMQWSAILELEKKVEGLKMKIGREKVEGEDEQG